MSNIVTIDRNFTDTAALNTADLIICRFDIEEILQGQVTPAVKRMQAISSTPKHTFRFMGKVVLEFSGRGRDPREIYQVPEAVKFFKAFAVGFPYLLHYLEEDIQHSLLTAFGLLAEAQPGLGADNRPAAAMKPHLVEYWLKTLTPPMEHLHHRHNLPPQVLEMRKRKLADAVRNWG